MTEYSLPEQGLTIGDAVLAPYSADNWATAWSYLIGFGASRADSGVIAGNGNGTQYSLQVAETSPTSANVTLYPGSAVVQGKQYVNDADLTLAIGANASGNDRIDTVILRRDYINQTIRAIVKQGTPAATPVPPTLDQIAGSLWEIPVCDVYVANGFSVITNEEILPRLNWANAPDGVYLDGVVNASGGVLRTGDVVVWLPGTDRAVTSTTFFGDTRLAGVWNGYTANGQRGRVQVRGLGVVNVQFTSTAGGVTVPAGTPLTSASTALYAAHYGEIANLSSLRPTNLQQAGGWPSSLLGRLAQSIAMPGGLGGTLDLKALTYVDALPSRFPRVYTFFVAGTGTFTSGSWQVRTFNGTISNDGLVNASGATFTDIELTPGYYHVRGYSLGYRVAQHQARIAVISGTATFTNANGSIAYTPSAADHAVTASIIDGTILVTATAVIQLQAQCQTTRATDGFGITNGFGVTQNSAQLTITRYGDYPA